MTAAHGHRRPQEPRAQAKLYHSPGEKKMLYKPHGEEDRGCCCFLGVPGFLSIKMSKKFGLSIKQKVWPKERRDTVKRVAGHT